MKTCPDCKSKTVKVGPPTLSGSFMLDQLIDCTNKDCLWCGVETETLTRSEVKEMKRKEKEPKQLRLL